MQLNLENSISKTKIANDNISNFINDLKKCLEKNTAISTETKQYNFIDQSERYKDYWDYQNDLEDNVCAILGISRCDREEKYFDKLYKAVDESIFEIAKREGTAIYIANGPQGSLQTSPKGRNVIKTVYDVTKYENGKIEDLKSMQIKGLPKTMDENGNYRNIILQINDKGKITVRDDLKSEIINLACEKCAVLKEQTIKEAKEYKKEGHLYEAYEDDGFIFLDDITESNHIFEDIDFVVDNYKGEGTYKVIDGEYTKISDKFYNGKE